MIAIRKIKLLLLAAAAVVWPGWLNAENFVETAADYTCRGIGTVPKLSVEEPLPGQGKMLRLAYDARRTAFVATRKKNPSELPEFDRAVGTLEVFIPEGVSVKNVLLCFVDAKGETFQYLPDEDVIVPGINVLHYTVGASGGRKVQRFGGDRRVDRPLRFSGVIFTFPEKNTPGAVFLKSLNFDLPASAGRPAAQKTVAARVPLYDFGPIPICDAWVDGAKQIIDNSVSDLKLDYPENREIRLRYRLRNSVAALNPFERLNGAELWLRDVACNGYIELSVAEKGQRKPVRFRREFKRGDTILKWSFPEAVSRIDEIKICAAVPGIALTLVRLDKLVSRPYGECFRAGINTGNALHLATPGQPRPRLSIYNCTGADFSGSVELKIDNYAGANYSETHRISIPAHGDAAVELSAPPSFGAWRVTGMLRGADGALARISAGFGYMDPVGESPAWTHGFIRGIVETQNFFGSDREMRLEAEAAGLCGVKMLRSSAKWELCQPNSSTDWNTSHYDKIYDAYTARGIGVATILGLCPKWAATTKPPTMGSVPDFDAWRRFCSRFVREHRGKIRFYEIWNEPDHGGFWRGSAEEFARLVSVGAAEIHREDPAAKVMNGGFVSVFMPVPRAFQADVMRQVGKVCDIHAHHEHGLFGSFSEIMEKHFFPMRRELGLESMPWFANETAWAPSGPGYEYVQAEQLYKKMLYSQAHGASAYFWYNLRNCGVSEIRPHWNYGLLTNDFVPKPAYIAYNALSRVFGGKEFKTEFPLGERCYAYVLTDGKEMAIASWVEDGAASLPAPQMLKVDSASAWTVDLMGNRKPAKIIDGLVLLTLGEKCSSLVLPGTASCENLGDLYAVDANLSDSGKVTVTVEIFNRAGTPEHFEVKVAAPAGVKLERDAFECELAPGKTHREVLRGTATAREALMRAKKLSGTIETVMRGRGETARSNFLMRRPSLKLAGGINGKAPDFVLERPEQVVAPFQAVAGQGHLAWLGAEDLSAKVSLGYSEHALRLKVDVTDDKHFAPYTGVESRNGDSVQFVLARSGERFWYFIVSRGDDGKDRIYIWHCVRGDREKLAAKLPVKTERRGNHTLYDITLPLSLLGISEREARDGSLRFDLLVADNDGGGLESWMQLSDGGVREKIESKFINISFN